MKPLHHCLTFIQGRNLHLSDALKAINILLKDLSTIEGNPYSESALECISAYVQDAVAESSAYSMTSALDPRFKDNFHLDKAKRIATRKALAEHLRAIYASAIMDTNEHTSDDENAWLSSISSSNPHRKQTQVMDELSQFLVSPSQDTLPCDYWKTSSSKWPLLSAYAMLWFSLQATEIENERNFSSTGTRILR
jgi:hypothetical protein